MITVRRAAERGHANHGWLDTRHTFSFADYYDPRHMGFRSLRVINEDRIRAERGFGSHPHRDMEILTWVVAGSLLHRDSLGNGSVIRPGDLQRMSAGTGVVHSEINPSTAEDLHLLQIWIVPERQGVAPSYEQTHFPAEARRGRLRLVASRDGRDGSVRLHQDADVHAALLAAGERVHHPIAPGRGVWLQVVRGAFEVDGQRLDEGDGAAVEAAGGVAIAAAADGEILLFDLA